MAGGSSNGLATAVETLGGFGALGLDGASQDDMFADADDAPGSLSPARLPERRGAGRPAGARNRSTEEHRQFFLRRYQSPVIGLGETYSRSAEDLARELFLTREQTHLAPGQQAIEKIERRNAEGTLTGMVYLVWDLEKAFRLQQEARIAAAPYVVQKQPMAVTLQSTERGLLLMGSFEGAAGGQSDALTIPFASTERNQEVSDAEIVQSDGEQSDAAAKPMTNQDNASDGH
jgi:hypothetical protein